MNRKLLGRRAGWARAVLVAAALLAPAAVHAQTITLSSATVADLNRAFDSGALTSDPYRVIVDRDWNTGRIRFEFRTPAGGNAAQTGGLSWTDHFPYLFKVEWRAGTARLRVFNGGSESSPVKVDLSVNYGAPYSPPEHLVVIGSLHNDSLKDMRVSSLWIGPTPRP